MTLRVMHSVYLIIMTNTIEDARLIVERFVRKANHSYNQEMAQIKTQIKLLKQGTKRLTLENYDKQVTIEQMKKNFIEQEIALSHFLRESHSVRLFNKVVHCKYVMYLQ